MSNIESKKLDDLVNKIKQDFLVSLQEDFLALELKGIKYNNELTVIAPIYRAMRTIIKNKIKSLPNQDILKKSILSKITIKEVRQHSVEVLNEKHNTKFKFKMYSGSVFVKNRLGENGKKLSTRDKNSSRLCMVVENFSDIEQYVTIVSDIKEWN